MMKFEAPKIGAVRLQKISVWAGPALIAATMAVMTWWTWGTWPDPLIDFGRELYFPWQIAAGKVLYRDLASIFGPLSPYFNALMFRLFGVSLLALVLTNLALLGVLLALLYSILRRMGSRLGATVGCLVALLVFAFGRYERIADYNFVCPYTHSATHGLILGVAAIYFMARYHRRPSPAWASAAGLALGLAFLTKTEMFAGAALAVATGLLLAAWAHGFTAGRLARTAGTIAGCAALPALAAWALLCLAMPPHEALRGMLGSWWYVFNSRITSLPFYRLVMGTNDAAGNLVIMLRSAAGYAEMLIPGAMLMLACRRAGRYRWVLAAVLFVAAAILMLWKYNQVFWYWTARPWPLFMVILAAAALVGFIRSRRSPDRGAQAALAAMTAVFALALLSRILLDSRINQYGFVLALPAGLVMVVALLDWAPRALDRMGGFGSGFRPLALTLIATAACWHVSFTRDVLSHCTNEVGAGADAFRTLPNEGEPVSLALKMIEENAGRSQTLAVLPEGVLMNYLARRPNPAPYTTYLGVELEAFGDEQMTESYKRHPPDFILLVHRDTTEYGKQFFGKDYGEELYRWIMSHYRPVGQIGKIPLQRTRQFGMLLLRRGEVSGDVK
ncbi:MAG: glycosyltransferase family 39 protein [Candidatus Brocadiia bacterium]|jgi:hypothetical protein